LITFYNPGKDSDFKDSIEMGHRDLLRIFPVVKYIRELEKKHNWGYVFRWDQGNKETWIGIDKQDGKIIYGYQAEDMNREKLFKQYKTFVPDIIDYEMKTIIEFEETPGKPRKGARLAKKGHDPDGNDKRTTIRDFYYEMAGFELFKVFDYQIEEEWKLLLKKFLIETFLIRKTARLNLTI